eukprot:scaffold71033_cov92-Phaeocystis_antarctica.AAC.6
MVNTSSSLGTSIVRLYGMFLGIRKPPPDENNLYFTLYKVRFKSKTTRLRRISFKRPRPQLDRLGSRCSCSTPLLGHSAPSGAASPASRSRAEPRPCRGAPLFTYIQRFPAQRSYPCPRHASHLCGARPDSFTVVVGA